MAPDSLFGASFIVLGALIVGLVSANGVWRDPRHRRERIPSWRRVAGAVVAAAWMALAAAAAAWALLHFARLASDHPMAIPIVAGALYGAMALVVAWERFLREGGVLTALLLGVLWLPLLVWMRYAQGMRREEPP